MQTIGWYERVFSDMQSNPYLMRVIAPQIILRVVLVNNGAFPSCTTASQPMCAGAKVHMKQIHLPIRRLPVLTRRSPSPTVSRLDRAQMHHKSVGPLLQTMHIPLKSRLGLTLFG